MLKYIINIIKNAVKCDINDILICTQTEPITKEEVKRLIEKVNKINF